MNTRLIISLLCAGALAFACGPRSHSEAPANVASTQSLHASTAKPVAVATVAPHSKKNAPKPDARLDSKLNVVVAQNDVRLALDVKNVGGKHAELTFQSGQAYDFVVVDSVGREVWRWSGGRMFTSGVQNKQLGVGDMMQLSENWEKAKPGHYTAIALLKSSNFPVEERVDFVMQ
ncbi:MAG TPA: BsuPI-related putative proteinase inhibitor [Gemmatimonadaceae bacterium]